MANNSLSSYENKIIEILKSYPDASIPIPLLEDVLNVESKRNHKKFRKSLNRLKQKEHIRISQGNLVRLNELSVEKEHEEIGELDVTARGDGYVMVEGRDQDIKIKREHMGTALHGDMVKVSLIGYQRRSNKPKGKIEEIIKRSNQLLVGSLESPAENTYLIKPDHRSARTDFFVSKSDLKDAKPGDKVTFRLRNWEDERGFPQASIVKTFGPAGTNEANVLSILAEKQFESSFPAEVESFAQSIPVEITGEEIAKRKDIRDEVLFTIDPEDAKDFDDALTIRVLSNGNYYLGVHIADVTHYMPRGSVLDKEACNRGTSVYLVDRVIPMMPERLSNGVCSLRPKEEKLCYSCFMEINPAGKLVNYSIDETVIYSDERFVYDEVQDILDGKKDHKFYNELKILEKLAHILQDKRFREGSINFETPEPKFVLDDQGKPIDVVLKERLFAHKLIEECMLMANKTVALHVDSLRNQDKKKVSKNDHPFFYRIHDKPDLEKLHNIRENVKPLGIDFDLKSGITASVFNKLLKEVENTSLERIINDLMLRSMAKAEYNPKNIGHFGLGFSHYSHFTSPIRRYPDVVVHRLLKRYQNGGTEYTYEELTELGEHCSERERYAVEAERDSVKLKQVEYLEDKLGESFDAIISGVTENGLYAELKNIHCEGMIRVSDLKDDYYVYNPQRHCLTGRSKGKQFRLGDEIRVKVSNTNLERRQIDLIPSNF